MKIRSKLFVLLVSLILTSFLAASFVSINVLSAAMIREIRSHLEDNSVNLMKRISTGTSNRISDIIFLGDSMNIFPNQTGIDQGKKLDLLNKFIGTHKDYSSVSVYNKTGIMIAGHKGTNFGENVSNESFFKRAIRGYVYRGISTEKEILLSGPIHDKSGRINGILVLTYPLEIEHAGTGLQSNLRISLLSDDGKVIYSNNGNPNYGSSPLSNAIAAGSIGYQPIFRLINSSNNTVESAVFNDNRFPSGNAVFVATKEGSNSLNPDIKNKWLLVTSLDTEEAFKGVLSLRNLFIIITVIVLAIAVIAIDLVVDRTISKPLTKLKNAAVEIGKGNLDLIIATPSTIDEIGELSSQFGKMRNRIKARTEELMERDKELKTSNEQLKEKERILEKANEELRGLDRLKDEFINVAAHELRTPIQPVLGLTQFIRSKINDKELCELLDVVIRNAKRLQSLAENILDITKIESQSLKLKKELFNLSELISIVVRDTRSEIESDHNGTTLSFESKKDLLFVEADKYRITQVISNLLDNAIKFTREEGTISITLQKNEDYQKEAIVSVKDTGTGIPKDILPNIFSKFVSKAEKGTGLGLFISKSIVEAHGGRIWAENNIDGKGATFSFSLPLQA